MASDKLDLPDDLLSTPKINTDPKGDEDKELLGLVDDSKDLTASENTIPLSPQWLYAKPSDSKMGASTALGETRALSIHGNLTDSIQKDAWRLDGSQDKKEWRRGTPELEGARRWRDEERETNLLVRRERRKEGDRETDNRKVDRRSDSNSVVSDARAVLSSDRRNEVSSRNANNETRRDSKWSSRWGPEDKEKEAKIEKKIETDRDNDSHNDKQPIVSGLRSLSESDSRDKWRPRHRQEAQSIGPSSYRAAPGFGLERGRIEGSIVGFSAGRGRSNSTVSRISRTFPVSTIGAVPFKAELALGKSNLHPKTFRYPRGKLLDIYRIGRLLIIDTNSDGLEENIPVTQSDFVPPLAFVPPDDEEVAVLKDIWKGKINSSEADSSPSHEKISGVDKSDIEIDSELDKDKGKHTSRFSGNDVDLLAQKMSECNAGHNTSVSLDNNYDVVLEAHDVSATNRLGNVKFDSDNNNIYSDVTAKLPDDSQNMLCSSLIEIPSSLAHENNTWVQLLGRDTNPEELSLFYLDPQGEVQGPFLGLDIISWFEQGFFGTDLPVCLSDAPEGSSFQPLGDIMPFLKEKYQDVPDSSAGVEIFENLSMPSDNMHGNAPDSTQLQQLSFDSSNHSVKRNVGLETSVDRHDDGFLFPMEEPLRIPSAGGELFEDSDEVMYKGRNMTSMDQELLLTRSSIGHHYSVGMAETSSGNKRSLKDNDVNRLDLLLSELEGNYPKHPLSLNITETDYEVPINQAVAPNEFLFGHKYEQLNIARDAPTTDVRPGNYRSDKMKFSGDHLESGHLSWLDSDANHLNEHVLLRLHKQQLEQQMQQQREQQMQQQREQQRQQQLEQQMQQLEQQRHQQLEYQRQQLLEQQKQQQLEQHLKKQHLQQQLHQRLVHQNVDLARPFLEQMHGSMHHQHSVNQPIQDIDHLLKLQFEQELHLRQVQQQHQLQQQLHQHIQMLRQQQQQHHHHHNHQQNQQQFLIEQLLHKQLLDAGLGTPNIDQLHADRVIDQLLLQHQLLNESQQPPHNHPLHHDPAIEHLIQTKFGQNLDQRGHDDLSDILSISRQRGVLSSEQQLLLRLQQEQLQAQHLSGGSRQQLCIDENRHMRGIWSGDEPGQFNRSAANPHHGYSARLSQLDIPQPPGGPSSFEEPSQMERNFLLHELMRQGHYESGLHPLERVAPRHSDTSGPNFDIISSLAKAHGSDIHKPHDQLHSSGRMGQFPSGIHSHDHLSDELFSVRREAMERQLMETNGQATNFMESHFHELQNEAERQKRGMKVNVPSEELNMWPSSRGNDGSSEHELREMVHQQSLLEKQTIGTVDDAPAFSFEHKNPAWVFSRSGTDCSIDPAADGFGLGKSLPEVSLFSKIGKPPNEQGLHINSEGDANSFDGNGRMALRPGSASLEQKQPNSKILERDQLINSLSTDSSRKGSEFLYAEGKLGKLQVLNDNIKPHSTVDMLEGSVRQVSGSENEEKKLVRHVSSGGGLSFSNCEMGLENAPNEQLTNISDNSLLKCTTEQQSVTSRMAVSEATSGRQHVRGKSSTSMASSDDSRQDSKVNTVLPSPESTTANKKDLRFRRTSSTSDADVAEPTFSEMLKSTRKVIPEADILAAADASETGNKGGKKKGKKGRQIDPSLLGFKVHSNRILMGEIQGLDD